MRRFTPFVVLATLVAAAACSDSGVQTPTTPGGDQNPRLVVPNNQYCTAKSASAIQAEIDGLFFKNQWPDPQSATGKFNNVQTKLAGNDLLGAQQTARDLVRFIANKFDHLTAAQQAASQADYDRLVADIYCFVGISGLVFDLNPGDPDKAFGVPGVGAVYFPANVVPVGTMVSITDISGFPPPLNTNLDTYAGYLEIKLIPSTVLPQNAIVALCLSSVPSGVAGPFLVGHNTPTGAFELLDPVAETAFPSILTTAAACSASSPAPSSRLGKLLSRIADALLPNQLQAAPAFLTLAIGGKTTSFSPVGVTNTTLVALGGKTTSFAPPADATAVQLAGAVGDFTGAAGTTTTTNVPSVTISTPNGTKIPGVQVTYATGPTVDATDVNSQAKVCDASQAVPASGQIAIQSDALGVAKLPCLSFGTLAGYANLAATFDASTLGFYNDNLINVVAQDGSTPTSGSLNWLVQTVAAAAATIKTYFPPAAPAQSYGYGSVTAYTNANPAPQVLVADQYGNVVGGTTVYWNANTSSGSTLTVGAAGATTNAAGVATVTSWNFGEGLNELLASIYDASTTAPIGFLPATFTGTTPTGQSLFACPLPGSSKTDLAPFSIKAPNGTVRTVTLSMSVTGQSSNLSAYPATIQVFTSNNFALTPIGSGSGTIALPGDNGNPVAQTFVLSNPATKTEMGNAATLYFKLTITAPSNRKVQLWYTNATFKNNDPCASSLVYTPTYPTSSTSKKGLAINVTN